MWPRGSAQSNLTLLPITSPEIGRQFPLRCESGLCVPARLSAALLRGYSKRYWKHCVPCGRYGRSAVLAGWVCRYPASPRASRIAAPDREALGMKARAGLVATSSAKSSSACVEIKIVGTAAPDPFR
jgi:hypothetical protein